MNTRARKFLETGRISRESGGAAFGLESLEQRSLFDSSIAGVGPQLVANAPNPGIVAVGDYNGDGMDDAAVAVGKRIRLFHGTATGNPTAVVGAGFALCIALMAACDENGDDLSDLVVVTRSAKRAWMRVLTAREDGTFDVGGAVEVPRNTLQLAAGQLDEVPGTEVVIAVPYSAGVNARVLVFSSVDGRLGEGSEIYRAGLIWHRLAGLAIGDVDGDGMFDVAFGANNDYQKPETSELVTLINQGELRFEAESREVEEGFVQSILFADLDGDEDVDLAFTSIGPLVGGFSIGHVHLALRGEEGLGDAEVVHVRELGDNEKVPGGAKFALVGIADVNSDGLQDLLVDWYHYTGADYSGSAKIWSWGLDQLIRQNDGSYSVTDTQWHYQVDVGVGNQRNPAPVSYCLADLRADGRVDVLRFDGGRLSLLHNLEVAKRPQIDNAQASGRWRVGRTLYLTALDVWDPDELRGGRVEEVRYFVDRNRNGVIDGADLLIGTATTHGVPPFGGWSVQSVPMSATWGPRVGLRILARAMDDTGMFSVPRQAYLDIRS